MITKWLKRKLGITQLEQDRQQLLDHIDMMRSSVLRHERFVNETMTELKSYIKVDADIGPRGANNTIIVSGVLKGKGFVKFYDMSDACFKDVVDRLQDMARYAHVRNIDKPYCLQGIF